MADNAAKKPDSDSIQLSVSQDEPFALTNSSIPPVAPAAPAEPTSTDSALPAFTIDLGVPLDPSIAAAAQPIEIQTFQQPETNAEPELAPSDLASYLPKSSNAYETGQEKTAMVAAPVEAPAEPVSLAPTPTPTPTIAAAPTPTPVSTPAPASQNTPATGIARRPRLRPAPAPASQPGKFSNEENTLTNLATSSAKTQMIRKSFADSDDEPTDPAIELPTRRSAGTTTITNPNLNIKMPELGPIDAFMKNPAISEIMVNDLRNVMIERDGQLTFSGFTYKSIDELNRLVRNILDTTGRILSPDQPYADVTLPDGSRVNIVGPPITNAPCVTIRKFPAVRYNSEDLVRRGMYDRKIAYFLNACVTSKINILVSGGTSTGKTTLLNVLAGFIPRTERVVMIEDTAELVIPHPNSVRMLTKPQSPTSPAVTARDLVANAMRMRPDRVIVGESRRSEAFDMLQAMNTGHNGSMTGLHANSPRDAISRLETLSMMAGVDLPLIAIRKQIVSAIDLVIQIKRHRNGKRRITAITEITGMEGDIVTMQDIFLFEHAGLKNAAEGTGAFRATGFVPTFIVQLREHGIEIPNDLFV